MRGLPGNNKESWETQDEKPGGRPAGSSRGGDEPRPNQVWEGLEGTQGPVQVVGQVQGAQSGRQATDGGLETNIFLFIILLYLQRVGSFV